MTYEIRVEGASEGIEAGSLEEAMNLAEDWLVDGWEPGESTSWVHGTLAEPDGGTHCVTVTVPPREPKCPGGSHDWQSPWNIVGGCRESPGVYGHGGGVTISEVCVNCGCGKVIDTWAQDPATGRQGLRSITYEEGRYRDEIDSN